MMDLLPNQIYDLCGNELLHLGNMWDQADMSPGSILVQANYSSYIISYFTNYPTYF
jgi:hypothetical protein